MSRALLLLCLLTPFGCGGRSRLPLPAPPVVLSATPDEPFADAPAVDDTLRPPALPALEQATLGNGMQVFVVRQPDLPLVSVVYASRAGTSQDVGTPPGVDSLLEWVLDRVQPGQDVDIVSSGATISSSGMASEIGRLIRDASAIVRMPTMPEGIVAEERTRLADEIVDASRSYFVRVYSVHEGALIYGSRDVRAQPWYGTLPAFRGLGADVLLARHHELFASDASGIAVVGDVALADVVALVEAAFGDWSAPMTARETLPPAAFPRPSSRLHVFPTSGPATIALRERAPHRMHEDRPAFEVATALLGGMFGSRINRVLREERGHTYGVHADLSDYRDFAVLEIDLAVPTTHARGTVFEIIHELERLQDESQLDAAELRSARATAMAGYRRWFSTRDTTASTLAYLFLRQDTLEAWSARTTAIAAVQAADVARVARAWLRPDAAPLLVSCGWMQALDLQNFVPGGTEVVMDH